MSLLKRWTLRRELKNQFESTRLREIFATEYGIEVGLYSYGCFDIARIPRGTVIGRYCSFAPTSYVLNGNHGIDFLALHPYLYNASLGLVPKETIRRTACAIEDDVWVGHNAVILPGCSSIGRGAVIAAGAVVTRNVPAYAIVAGNPARILRYRFAPQVIERIEALRWWQWTKEELALRIKEQPDLLFRPANHFDTKEPNL